MLNPNEYNGKGFKITGSINYFSKSLINMAQYSSAWPTMGKNSNEKYLQSTTSAIQSSENSAKRLLINPYAL